MKFCLKCNTVDGCLCPAAGEAVAPVAFQDSFTLDPAAGPVRIRFNIIPPYKGHAAKKHGGPRRGGVGRWK